MSEPSGSRVRERPIDVPHLPGLKPQWAARGEFIEEELHVRLDKARRTREGQLMQR